VVRGGDPALDEFAVGGEDAELALALVEIESYRIHGGWPPGWCLAALTAFHCGAEHCHHVAGAASRFITTELGR